MFEGGFGSLTFASFLYSCLRIKTNKPSLQPSSLRHSSDFENSEDDKRTIIASLKKKAINASSKFRHSLKKKRSWKKNGGQINSVSIEDVWDAGELQAVDAFRLALISEDLLPPRHDDCHMLLREGFDGVWEWDLPITSQPCIEQQAYCLNLVQKG